MSDFCSKAKVNYAEWRKECGAEEGDEEVEEEDGVFYPVPETRFLDED